MKTVHVLVLHHHTGENHPVCEATHDANSAHIHDESWAKEDCLLCAFVVSVPEPFTLPLLQLCFSKVPDIAVSVFYHAPVIAQKVTDVMMRRGPPAPNLAYRLFTASPI